MRHVVIATLMRREGATGVQSHVRAVGDHARATGTPLSIVTPFEARSPLLAPAFAVRAPLRRLSRPAAVWWYRAGHAHYLRQALAARLKDHPDAVIYAQCPVSAAVALEVRTEQPVVMAAHFNVSQADEWAEKGELRAGGDLFDSIRALEARTLPRLEGIVYVSADSRRRVEERLPDVASVRSAVIPNPVPIRSSSDTGSPSRDVVSVGSLEPRKNHSYLLDVVAEAARAGRRYTLTLVGDGPERSALAERATRLGIGDLLRFTGHLDDVGPTLADHRVYAHTATMESFGIALVEAMGVGLPVLTGRVGGIPEIVRSDVDGQFWPLDDAPAAARMLNALMADPERRNALGRAASARAREYAPETLGPRLLAFLDDATKRG